MENKKARITIEFKINSERCKAYNLTPEEVLENMLIRDSDIIDAYEIFPSIFGMDVASDFMLEPCPDIISKEFVPEKPEKTAEPVDVVLVEKDELKGLSSSEATYLAKKIAGTEDVMISFVDLFFIERKTSLLGFITKAAAARIHFDNRVIRKAVETRYDYDKACFTPGILETDKLRISIEKKE